MKMQYQKQANIKKKEISEIERLSEGLEDYIVLQDGHIVTKKVSSAFDDLMILTYDEALQSYPALFNELVNVKHPSSDAYQYNFDECNSGLLLYLPKKKRISKPLHIFYVATTEEFTHNTFLYLEQESELNYFEHLFSDAVGSYSYVSNAIVHEAANLTYGALSNLGKDVASYVYRNASVDRYGISKYSLADVGDAMQLMYQTINLNGEYASGTSKTIAITSGVQEARYETLLEHNALYSEGYIEHYGVANNESALIFEGIGQINKGMKQSIARQQNHGIVLGEKARLDANPLLLIDEYDVIASHGAAIGKIDDDELYYLMSRGLTEKAAQRLIINGFLSPVMSLLETDTLKNMFLKRVEEKTL
ncbi:MAG: SufD family Fe-S cluster assembly protein [Candidatus Izemoplasmataceae bacterium]